MMRTTFVVCILLADAATSRWCTADEPVYGPAKLLIKARIDQGGPRERERFVASYLAWDESSQYWTRSRELSSPEDGRAFRGSTVSSPGNRKVIVLQSEHFVQPMNVLTFSKLDGQRIEPSQVPEILEAKRAVAFVPKGCAIHPEIAAALHPDTLVISRRSYREDPIIVPLPERP